MTEFYVVVLSYVTLLPADQVLVAPVSVSGTNNISGLLPLPKPTKLEISRSGNVLFDFV